MNNIENDKLLKKIHERITGRKLKVVLPEGSDDRVIDAVGLTSEIVKILLGDKKTIEEKLVKKYNSIPNNVEIIDENEFSKREDLVNLLVEKRKGKLELEEAKKLVTEPNYFATLLLENGDADALVGGCVYSTADILKPAFQIIKTAPGNNIVSSCFLMTKENETLVFADCAVNIEPNSEQLADITKQTIETAKNFDIEPKVAMLSYSTKGSGAGEYVDKVREAYELLIKENNEYVNFVDGELQFDAAYVEKVGKAKSPGSKVAGNANVFIFPHIIAGNIGYKMVQYLGNYEAVGPVLQGLNKPVNDLSRGADALAIAKTMYVSLRNS